MKDFSVAFNISYIFNLPSFYSFIVAKCIVSNFHEQKHFTVNFIVSGENQTVLI